jgi:hypothetical protein
MHRKFYFYLRHVLSTYRALILTTQHPHSRGTFVTNWMVTLANRVYENIFKAHNARIFGIFSNYVCGHGRIHFSLYFLWFIQNYLPLPYVILYTACTVISPIRPYLQWMTRAMSIACSVIHDSSVTQECSICGLSIYEETTTCLTIL